MAVRFILGRSGTGKTSYCIKAIVDALLEPSDQQLILLVPEQATYQAERAILSDERIAGYHRLHVLSFDRLQFMLLGKNTAGTILSRIAQQMVVHKVLRDNKNKLRIFGSSATSPGLSRRMTETIAEMHQYAKTPEDIDLLLGELQKDERNSLAVLKFADIGLVLKEYLNFIEGRFIDPDIQLTCACQAIAGQDFAKGAKLWVDGFAGFTTAEFAVLAELLKVVESAQIALCLDPSTINLANPDAEGLDPAGLFNPTERTYSTLIETIRKSKLKLAEPVILDEAIRFSENPQLAHVERNIFKLRSAKAACSGRIRIISAPNARAEVQFVARQIIQLVKERGYRYRDIAVIASDIDDYQHYIRAYLGDYGVPFFIDKRRPLNHHPVVQLISSALQVVSGGFAGSDVFAYLKTDLVPAERHDIDLLENYCLAFGVSGSDWQSDKEWHFAGREDEHFDEQRVNRIRRSISGPLLELQNSLCPPDNRAKMVGVEEFVRVIFGFLDDLKVRQTMGSWTEAANDAEDDFAADEHRQFYDKLIDIFDKLVEVFAGQAMTAEDYLAVLNSAFSQLTLAFIPPTLDQVLVGSIERSRHPDLKAVFLIGATQRQFPAPIGSDSILSDSERSIAESADFHLAAAASQTLAERQYLAYIAFTRPSEFVCATYPSTDDKGSAVPRSQFVDELESLFEDLSEELIAQEPADIDKINTEAELADLLCSRLGRDALVSESGARSRLENLLNDVCSDEQLAELGSTILAAIDYDNCARLDEDVVGQLFGQQMKSSATRLGTFAACPYRYFARYVLELREREEFKFEPLDLGAFYHCVLDVWLKRLNAEGRDLAAIDDGEVLRLLREEIQKLIATDSFIANFISRRGHNEFIINSAGEVLEDCVLAIAQMVRAGSFRPRLSEVSFGHVKDASETLDRFELALAGGRVLSLDGKIDRLDVADIQGEKVAVVFDYKRSDSRAKFDWSKFYHGLDMQLPIYILAVRHSAHSQASEVAGAFYVPVETQIGQTTLDELPKRADKFTHKARGMFNGRFAGQLDREASQESEFYNFYVTKDGQPYGNYGSRGALRAADFEKVLEFAEHKIVKLGEEIGSGRISVQPYRIGTESPCSYCEYKSVCRFDWQINEYNVLESLNKVRALERMNVPHG